MLVARRRRPWRASVVALAGVAAAALVAATPALAHVEAHPEQVEAGTYPVLTFVVPNERKAADTVKVELKLPDDAPFAYVAVRTQPGWQSTTTTRPLPTPVENHGTTVSDAVSVITWTGGSIPPGRFTEFAVEMGPVPDVSRLVFGAIQTYSDGTEVRWNESVPPGAPEPDQPAPTVDVGAAPSSGAEEAPAATSSPGSTTVATVLAACAFGFAVVALVAAVAALARRRRAEQEPEPETEAEG